MKKPDLTARFIIYLALTLVAVLGAMNYWFYHDHARHLDHALEQRAGAKLDVLDRLPIRVAGAVLNDVKPGADGYYYGYYSYYMPGYVAEDERAGASQAGTLVKETAGS